MYNRLLLSLLFFATSITISYSQKIGYIGDYGKQIFEVLKSKDDAKFESKMLVKEKDFVSYFSNLMKKDPVFKEMIKNEPNFNMDEVKKLAQNFIKRQKTSYKEFCLNEKYQEIDWKNATYLDTYYELERSPREPFFIEAEVKIKFKSADKYYLMRVKDIFGINGKWSGGRISNLKEVDIANKTISQVEDSYPSAVDSAAVSAVPDTAMAAPYEQQRISEVLEGTIGNSPIVIRIEGYDTQLFGTYYYKKYKADIQFYGSILGDDYILNVVDGGSEKFTLKKIGDTWTGTWEGGNKKLPVGLKPVEIEKVKHNHFVYKPGENIDPYSFIRTSDIQLTETSEEIIAKKYKIKWYTDPVKQIKGFRIVEGLPKNKMDFINEFLTREQIGTIEYRYTGVFNDKETYSFNSVYITENIFSASFITKVQMRDGEGTAITAINLDLNHMAVMGLDDFLEFTYPTTNGEDVAMSEDEFRKNTLGAAAVKILKKNYPDKMKQEECKYNMPDTWIYGSWYFTEKGMFLGANYPAPRECRNLLWSILPYKDLKNYYRKDSGVMLPTN